MADRRGKKQRRLQKARMKSRGARIVRHKLIGGRTGGKASHQLKNFKRGKAAVVSRGKQRFEVYRIETLLPDFSIYAVRRKK